MTDETTEQPLQERVMIKTIKLDGLVVMKIIKHCHENFPLTVTGQLLGMDFNDVLEVTNGYPFPQVPTSALAADDLDAAATELDQSQYQMNMMRCVRDVNIDHQVVGWYQSSGSQMGSFLTPQWIETQFSYQDNLQNVVCLVFDPVQTESGTLGIRAYRLSRPFMEMRKRGEFNSLGFSRFGLDSTSIIEELPVILKLSSLQKAYLAELFCGKELTGENDVELARLSIPENPTVEQTMEFTINNFDELNREQNKYFYFVRSNTARIASLYQEMTRVRRQGREGGPDDGRAEMEQLASAMSIEPSRLESKMLTRELNSYVEKLATLSVESVVKENAVFSLRTEQSSPAFPDN